MSRTASTTSPNLLLVTKRFAEAEPLMHRALTILVGFEAAAGHRHPSDDFTGFNYRVLLGAIGRSESEMEAAATRLAGVTHHEDGRGGQRA